MKVLVFNILNAFIFILPFFCQNLYSNSSLNGDISKLVNLNICEKHNYEFSDTLKRMAELNRILSVLPPDITSGGRVSYLDETFKDWLVRTKELPPNFDNMPSIPFLPDPLISDEGGENIPITSDYQWSKKKEWIRRQLSYYITGTIPPAPNNLKYKILSEKKDGEITIRIVKLIFGPGDRAKLTLELMIPPGEGPFPVFLTNWNHKLWAHIAVRRGYIGCLYAGADIKDDTEEYSEIWAGQYDFTRLMRRAYGASRAIDYLYTLPYVDKQKIGITGHSRNAKTSLMAAAFDERIGACISSSGGTGAEVPWRYNTNKYDVEDIAYLSSAKPSWLHPRLRFFIGREHKLPIDQNSFMALIAPRGLMLSTAITEHASNIFGIEQCYLASKSVFEFLNKGDNIAIRSRYGLHGVNAGDIEEYIDFFDYIFKRNNKKPENKLSYNYSFEKWLKSTKEKVELESFKIRESNINAIGNSPITLDTWKIKKRKIKKDIQWLLGKEPAGLTNPGPRNLDKGGIGENSFGSFLTRPITTDLMKVMPISNYNGFGDYLNGYLYYPVKSDGEVISNNLPIIIYLHEFDYSKGFSSMGYERNIQFLFENLTKMGFGVFSFDMIGFGNRLSEGFYFYDRYPEWSKMGKMVTDVKSSIDAIANLDFVDSTQIYTLGYSLGATVSLFTAALDDRIAGVISVSGFTPMATNTLDKGTEGIKSYSHLHGLIPKLGFFVGSENRIPVDFNEIISCIAPRPLLIIAPIYDKDAHYKDIETCMEDVLNIYNIYGYKERVEFYSPNDYNRFSPNMRIKSYEWFKNQLNGIDKRSPK